MPDESKANSTPPPAGKQSNANVAAEVKVSSPNPPQSSPNPEAKPVAAAPAAPKPAAPASAAAVPAKAAVPPKPAGPTPQPWDNEFLQRLKKVYGSGIREASTYLGQNYLVADQSIVNEILSAYRDDEGFDYLVDLTAVHYPKREKLEFDVVYILYSFAKNTRVRVKTQIADGAVLPSAVDIWPTANWLEREIFDMFGIRFEGHPDLKRILLPDGWQGYPLRKDYGILQQDQAWVQSNLGIESGQ
ncbi:MAG TPA: NADH-quinone oxidoreductase subunit C [Terriglobales bacterium]|nr:NADH-quinone oxidoreductase subunit C [Terriglobales bacterium]